MFSLANSFLTSLFSVSILLARGTKTVTLVEAILGEEKSYPKLVQLEVDFWRLRARLVIEFENCCLKRCENCCLKSVVEKRVF